MNKTIVVRGAGDIATGIIIKLQQCGFKVVALEIEKPTAIRRYVSFSEAVYEGHVNIEGVEGINTSTIDQIHKLQRDQVGVIIDPLGDLLEKIKPDAFVDATLNKVKGHTKLGDAPVVIGVGPGFEVNVNCHAVIETNRGHDLGRVYYLGSASENTGVPGTISGYNIERVIRASHEGQISIKEDITAKVSKGDVIATIDGRPVYASIDGIIRGMIRSGTLVKQGMKIADIDPRVGQVSNCYKVSDKARCIAGGVLEAVIKLKGGL